MVTFGHRNVGPRGRTGLCTSAALVGLLFVQFAPPSHADSLSGEAAAVATVAPDSALAQLIDEYLTAPLYGGQILDPAGSGGAYAEIGELGQAADVAVNNDLFAEIQDVEGAITDMSEVISNFEEGIQDVTGTVTAVGSIGAAF